MEQTSKIVHENPDSIELGAPSKGGAIKVYGDFNQPDFFKKKIDRAVEVRKYFQQRTEEEQNGGKEQGSK